MNNIILNIVIYIKQQKYFPKKGEEKPKRKPGNKPSNFTKAILIEPYTK